MSEQSFGCPKCGGVVTIADVVHATVQREYNNEGISSTEEFDYKSSVDEKCIECGESFNEEEWKKPKHFDAEDADVASVVREVFRNHSGSCLDNQEEVNAIASELVKRLTSMKAE